MDLFLKACGYCDAISRLLWATGLKQIYDCEYESMELIEQSLLNVFTKRSEKYIRQSKRGGVYMISVYVDKTIGNFVYIGRSKFILKRLYEHLRDICFFNKMQSDPIHDKVYFFAVSLMLDKKIDFRILSGDETTEKFWIEYYSKNRNKLNVNMTNRQYVINSFSVGVNNG